MTLIEVDKLLALFGDWYVEEGTNEGFIGTIKDLIETVPTIEQPHWIPCSERTPEEYGEYQITWTTSYLPTMRFIGDSEFELTGEYDHEHGRFKGEWLLPAYIQVYPDVKVLAWMPLPEPWRGGEE